MDGWLACIGPMTHIGIAGRDWLILWDLVVIG